MGKMYNRMKPFIAVIFMQIIFAGTDVLSKATFNKGMNNYVFVVYRHAVATIVMAPFAFFLDKKTRPKMTFSIFVKIVILSILEPVIDNNLFFLGLKETTATLAVALINIVPGITFAMACILRIEKIQIKNINSQAKIIGTVTTFFGAILMTLLKGPAIGFYTKTEIIGDATRGDVSLQNTIKGPLMILIGCFSGAAFIILQGVTLETYPAALSLTVWICLLGTAEAAVVAFLMERGDPTIWSLAWDTNLVAVLTSGLLATGLAYYILGIVNRLRGPVFVTAFNPLNMVIVAVMSFFILSEKLFLGRIGGAIVIVAGLYLVIWGKRYDYNSEAPLGEEKTSRLSNEMISQNHIKGKIQCDEIIIVSVSKEGTTPEKQKIVLLSHEKEAFDKTMKINAPKGTSLTLEQ